MGVRVTSHPPKLVESEVTEAGRVSEVVTGMKRVVRWGRANPPANVHFVLLSRPARRHKGGDCLPVIIVVCIVKVVLVICRVRTGHAGVARRSLTGLHGWLIGGGPVCGGLVEVERRHVEVLSLLLPPHPHGLLRRLIRVLRLLVPWGGVVLLLLRLILWVGGGGGGVNLVTNFGRLLNSLIDLSDRLSLTSRSRWSSPDKSIFKALQLLKRTLKTFIREMKRITKIYQMERKKIFQNYRNHSERSIASFRKLFT